MSMLNSNQPKSDVVWIGNSNDFVVKYPILGFTFVSSIEDAIIKLNSMCSDKVVCVVIDIPHDIQPVDDSALLFGTTKNGTTEPKINFVIDHDGTIKCQCDTNSSSPTTGSLTVNGGCSINKCLYIGNITYHNNDIYFNGLDDVSSILNYTESNFDKKIINLCGGGGLSPLRGSKITVSGTDSIMDGKIQINAGVPNGIIELSTDHLIVLWLCQNRNHQQQLIDTLLCS